MAKIPGLIVGISRLNDEKCRNCQSASGKTDEQLDLLQDNFISYIYIHVLPCCLLACCSHCLYLPDPFKASPYEFLSELGLGSTQPLSRRNILDFRRWKCFQCAVRVPRQQHLPMFTSPHLRLKQCGSSTGFSSGFMTLAALMQQGKLRSVSRDVQLRFLSV